MQVVTERVNDMKQSMIDRLNELGGQGKPFVFCLDYEMSELILLEEPLAQQELRFDIGGVTNSPARSVSDTPAVLQATPISEEAYAERFAVIRHALERGDSFLANLTVATPIELNISLEEVFLRSQARYKCYLPGRFVCFSTETFVRIVGREISCFPMKGTIDATLPDAAATILGDYKETAEHYTITDLIRNDLSCVSHDVAVRRFRYIDELVTSRGHLLQVSSEIVGQLAPDWRAHLGSILSELLPAGSISGAPKEATVRAIATAEGEPRGFYTGICGYFDGETLDSGVMIRFIEQQADGALRYRSGGGITINSHCAEEYREVCQKVYLPFV